MTTQPINEILPRIIENPELERILNQFSLVLEEVVNFGTHVLDWCFEKPGGDENLPIILSLRHILELLDSISILVKQSSIDPCKLILRGTLESYLGLEYILQAETNKRSLAFLVCYIHQTIKWHEKVNPNTDMGKQFRAIIEKDKTIDQLKIQDLQNKISHSNAEQLLNNPAYTDANNEYLNLVGKGVTNPPWYRLYCGPMNIEQLAQKVNLTTWYEVLYRYLSGTTHGTDILQGKIASSARGELHVVQIRYFKDAQLITGYTMTIAIKTYILIINKILTSKRHNFREWYQSIKKFYLEIQNGENIIN
jgi:hypothetical protein